MRNSKDTSRKISKVSLQIATCVDRTATAALDDGKTHELPISVAAALAATKE